MLVVLLVMGAVVATVSAVLVGGLLLPATHVIVRSRIIACDARELWPRLAEPHRFATWQQHVRSVDVTSHAPLRWREFTSEGAFAWEQVSGEPPTRLVLRAIDEDVQRRPERVFTLTPGPDGTEVTCTETARHANPITRFVYRYLLRPEPALEALLDDLARTVPATA